MNFEPIPFNRPYVPQAGLDHLDASVRSAHHAGDGPFTAHCAALLEKALGVRRALMTPSCTAALELSALLLDLLPGDEVILPAYTFVSTVNAFVLRGLRPVFCDARLDTANLDADLLEGLVTERTRAVVVVHYGGLACDMDCITEVCTRRGLVLIEDLAHGPFATWQGRALGTFGAMATLSFHHTKNFSCGEGGALLINDPSLVRRAEILREKGTNRAQFFRGEVDKYTWVDLGSSYLLADPLSALLLGALEAGEDVQANRHQTWQRYREGLEDLQACGGFQLQVQSEGAAHSAHLFHLVLDTLERRQAFIRHMAAQGIQCPFHYQSLPDTPMGQRTTGPQADCIQARELSDRLVRLPLWFGLPEGKANRVVAAARDFLGA